MFFLKLNNMGEEFVGLETIEYIPNQESVRKPFKPKPSYLVVYGTRGIIQTKNTKLVEEIKKAI